MSAPKASRPKAKRAAIITLTIVGVGLLVVTLVAFVARESLLRAWYRHRLESGTREEGFVLARELENAGVTAREVAEAWYIAVLESHNPTEIVLTARDPAKAVVEHGRIVKNATVHRQIVSYYHEDEAGVAPAAARLAALGSHGAIDALVRALERSRPRLPHIENPFGSPGRGPSTSPLMALHFTTAALYELRAVDAILDALGSESELVRYQAVYALDWILAVGIEDDVTRDRIERAIIERLVDPKREVRNAAGAIIYRTPRLDAAAVEVLPRGLAGDEKMALDAGVLFVNLAARNPRAAQALTDVLRDRSRSAESRTALLRSFDIAGNLPAASLLEEALVELLREGDAALRRQATYVIRKLGAKSRPTIDALARILLDDSDKSVRHGAALALRDFAPASRPAIPALRKALKDRAELVRRFARYALEALGEL